MVAAEQRQEVSFKGLNFRSASLNITKAVNCKSAACVLSRLLASCDSHGTTSGRTEGLFVLADPRISKSDKI